MSLEQIPSVHELVEHLSVRVQGTPRPLVVDATRAVLDDYRRSLKDTGGSALSSEALAERVVEQLDRDLKTPLAPVLNATGVILHTGLGRQHGLRRRRRASRARVVGGLHADPGNGLLGWGAMLSNRLEHVGRDDAVSGVAHWKAPRDL